MSSKHHLSIDIETKSSVDIGKAGSYRYAQSPDFEILLFGYQLDNLPVEVVDLAKGEEIPEKIVNMLENPNVIKHAYNAAFEWYCLNRAGYTTRLPQWRCTMFHSLYCGYAAGLDATGKAIGLPQGFPDLLFCGFDGQAGFIEVKRPHGAIREAQRNFIALMRGYGYPAGIARSPEEALRIIVAR